MNIAEEFEQLYSRWKAETMFHSNPRLIYENENLQSIIKLGLPALPFIAAKIQERQADMIYMVIPDITGIPFQEVIPEDAYGYIQKICYLWVLELRKRNLI